MTRYSFVAALCALAAISTACTQEAEVAAAQASQTASVEPVMRTDGEPAEFETATGDAPDPAFTAMCAIRETPDAFDGRTITVRARYVDLNSYAMLADSECPNWAMRYIRAELAPSDAVFDGTVAFLENVLMHGSTTFFTDTIDVYADFTGTYYRQRDADHHVLIPQSVANIAFEERAAE